VPQIQRYTFLATNLRLVEAGWPGGWKLRKNSESAQFDRTGREVIDISDGRVASIVVVGCVTESYFEATMSSGRLVGLAEVEGLAISL
jgi:hypothetical protein